MDSEETFTIREVESVEEADAILTVRLSIPNVIESGQDEFYLARSSSERPLDELDCVVTATRGRCEEMDVYRSLLDGRTAGDREWGYSKSTFIKGQSDEVLVRLSISWTARDGSCGELETELTVPWFGAGQKDLGGGAWIAGHIRDVEDQLEE